MHGKIPHGLNGRTFPPVQLQRKAQDHLSHGMSLHEGSDVGDITIECPAFEGLERLCGPAELITERNADPLGPVIQRQYA